MPYALTSTVPYTGCLIAEVDVTAGGRGAFAKSVQRREAERHGADSARKRRGAPEDSAGSRARLRLRLRPWGALARHRTESA
jgi:hypothetical protein